MKMFGILGILMKSSAQQCGGTSVPLVDLAFLLENLKWLFEERREYFWFLEDISCEINKVTDGNNNNDNNYDYRIIIIIFHNNPQVFTGESWL